MPIKSSTLTSVEPDQNLLHTAYFVEQVSLLLVIQIATINLLCGLFAPVAHLLPASLTSMSVASALAAQTSTIALFLSEPSRSLRNQSFGKAFAGFTTFVALISLWASVSSRVPALQRLLHDHDFASQHSSEIASAACFALLGVGILLIRSRESFAAKLADGVASCVAILLLVIVAEVLFRFAKLPGTNASELPPIPSVACLVLLTFAILVRRAELGIFSVFLGCGIGGRVARILAPVLLLLPLIRELGRARLLNAQLIPMRHATAVLTSTAIAIGFVLLMFLCRLINSMQTEIQNLTLRDELTGLYNFRGFNLFAEQAFRLARRAGQDFGVLFVDMDNLKKINDESGHNLGSVCLVEIARLLKTNFRETDVIGRLGGDEFVVAGQFDAQGISSTMERLRSDAFNARLPGVRIPLSLSMGYALTTDVSDETMKAVVARADKAMYKDKRAKKRSVSEAEAIKVG